MNFHKICYVTHFGVLLVLYSIVESNEQIFECNKETIQLQTRYIIRLKSAGKYNMMS